MKVAYLCLGHKNYKYINMLAKHLTSEGDGFFLHLDLDSEEYKEGDFSFVTKVLPKNNRIKTSWGTFGIVQATINLLRVAFEENKYSRYILISGMDYPLYKAKDMSEKILSKGNNICFWNVYDMSHGSLPEKSISSYHNFNVFFNNPRDAYISGSFLRRLYAKTINGIMSFKKNELNLDVYAKGSQWWGIDNEFCNYILQNSNTIPPEFYHMLAPDEVYFHSLYLNYINSNKVECMNKSSLIQANHYIDWFGVHGEKQEFTKDQINIALDVGALFARKFNGNEL